MSTSATLPLRSLKTRRTADFIMRGMSLLMTSLGILILLLIIFSVFERGFHAFNWAFFTQPSKPFGIPDGGIANALLGTLWITLGASLIGVPLGLAGGIYLSEYGRSSRMGHLIRFSANLMMGIPSIIVGLFVYALVVATTRHASGFAGSLALAILMFPVVLRTTEDMLTMVPNELRESALAVGMPRWRATQSIIFRQAKTGLLTGILLSVARVSGETAPLLFTALFSDSWPSFRAFFTEPTANLTVMVTNYATNSPYPEMQQRAWGASLIIALVVLLINIIARTAFRDKK